MPPSRAGKGPTAFSASHRDLCTTPFVREGAAALAPSPRRPLHNALRPRRCGPLLLPLPVGEGWGEGLPGNSPPDYAKVSPRGEGWGEGSSGQQSLGLRKGLSHGETFAQRPASSKVRPLLLPLPVGEGWGEGLPGNSPPDYAKVSPRGEGWGEGSSGQQSLGLRKGLSHGETFAQRPASSKVRPLLLPLPVGEGWGEGLPGNPPRITQRSHGGVGRGERGRWPRQPRSNWAVPPPSKTTS